MTDKEVPSTTYVPGEGRAQLDICMAATFNYCKDNDIEAIVIYTANGEGPRLAVERFSHQRAFSHIRIIAVTPPANRPYVADPNATTPTFVRTGIFGELRKLLRDAQVQIVSARLPFRPVAVASDARNRDAGPTTTDPMQLVDRAFSVLGGGFSFCIQAALMACDAGAVAAGERVAAMSADTSLVVLASQSESFLSSFTGLLVNHIICRPVLYDISKRFHYATEHALAQRAQADAPVQTELSLGPGESDAEPPSEENE